VYFSTGVSESVVVYPLITYQKMVAAGTGGYPNGGVHDTSAALGDVTTAVAVVVDTPLGGGEPG
jgi:hypothetical protein